MYPRMIKDKIRYTWWVAIITQLVITVTSSKIATTRRNVRFLSANLWREFQGVKSSVQCLSRATSKEWRYVNYNTMDNRCLVYLKSSMGTLEEDIGWILLEKIEDDYRSYWKLIERNVCFEGEGDKPGEFVAPRRGLLTRVKLVHKSGSITCWTTHPPTLFGCDGTFPYDKQSLGVFVTDSSRNVLFPAGVSTARFYRLPGYNAMSKEVELHDLESPSIVEEGAELQLWYGEDLFTETSENLQNSGRVCVDVYFNF